MEANGKSDLDFAHSPTKARVMLQKNPMMTNPSMENQKERRARKATRARLLSRSPFLKESENYCHCCRRRGALRCSRSKNWSEGSNFWDATHGVWYFHVGLMETTTSSKTAISPSGAMLRASFLLRHCFIVKATSSATPSFSQTYFIRSLIQFYKAFC